MLGAVFAILSAASFAMANASVRRGVLSGTPIQAMAVSLPFGLVCFLPLALVTGELFRLPQFPATAALWMAGYGVLHYLYGRYCNFHANAIAGVNLTAPVVQLQVVVTMVLAVVALGEPCSALQMTGGALMLAGSLITQRAPARTAAPPSDATSALTRVHSASKTRVDALVDALWRHEEPARPWLRSRAGRSPQRVEDARERANGSPARAASATSKPGAAAFKPRYVMGYLFASLAALAYGSSWVIPRFALADAGPAASILGGLISYVAAIAVGALALLLPNIRRNVFSMKRESARWFVGSGVFVALAQGLFFAAVTVAPIMLVIPLIQLSLAFRILFSTWLSPTHEVVGGLVLAGVVTSIAGALLVSVDSAMIVRALALPEGVARFLLWGV